MKKIISVAFFWMSVFYFPISLILNQCQHNEIQYLKEDREYWRDQSRYFEKRTDSLINELDTEKALTNKINEFVSQAKDDLENCHNIPIGSFPHQFDR